MSGLILQFAFTYTDDNRAKLSTLKSVKEMETYLKRQNILEQFVVYADKNGLKRRNLMIQKSQKLLERFLRYAAVTTQSKPESGKVPSTPGQWELARLLVKDIEEKSETTNAAASTSSDSDSKTEETTAAATSASDSSGSSDSSSDEESNALISQFTGTFVFGSVDDYNQFKEAVKNKAKESGQDEDMYIVTSSDVATFKAGLKPLENLKSFATTFLYLTLAIGAIVLIVISVISIRDRKYEIGALAAMGLKKLRLSMMFMIEVLTVTLVAILIGAVAGSVASVPVTSYLLSAQVEQQQTADSSKQQQPGMPGGNMERPDDGEVDTSKVEYVTADDIGFSVDIFVILKMLAIGVVLAIVSGFTSILFILRYDPKQILANRD